MEPVLDEVAPDSECEDITGQPPWYRFAARAPTPAPTGVVVARFAGFDLREQPLVADLACMPGQILPAESAVTLRRDMVGARVVLVFDRGPPEHPIILGVIQDPGCEAARRTEASPLHAEVDGERIVIEAERELVLRCGDASITLTRAGKVLLKGNYILSRSSGYNKIKGAAVDIN